jgi:hypothetical protein
MNGGWRLEVEALLGAVNKPLKEYDHVTCRN